MTDDNARRQRRRLRRQAAVLLFLMLAFALAWFFESQATTTVIFVRYAEVEAGPDTDPDAGQTMSDNPGLSAAGRARAEELKRLLTDVDVVAGVDAIFATQYRRTQETVEPLAKRLRLKVQVVEMDDIKGLLNRIMTDYKGKIVLVATHTGPLPTLIEELHGSKKLPAFGATEHDNLYIVSIPWYGKVKTLRLRYGAPYRPLPTIIEPPPTAVEPPPASAPAPAAG